MNFPTYDYENELKKHGFKYVVGVDEAGRGPGAGPVVAGAVNIPDNKHADFFGRVKDSKKLSEKRREALYDDIMEHCYTGIGIVDNHLIDKINILEATKIAIAYAINEIQVMDYVLIDGRFNLEYLHGIDASCLVKGDSISVSIAAASIIAKVTRDRIMYRLHEEYPIYNWKNNKGYLTKEHVEAIKLYGPCEYHRITFNKVG